MSHKTPAASKIAAWVALAAIVLGVVATIAAPFLVSEKDAAQVAASAQ